MQPFLLLLCIGQFLTDAGYIYDDFYSDYDSYFEQERSKFCESNPCQNGAECVTHNSYAFCNCHKLNGEKYYSGEYCENVLEKNPCYPDPCNNRGWCSVDYDAKSFICNCQIGTAYYGDRCQNVMDFRNSTVRFMNPFWKEGGGNYDCGYLQLKINGTWGSVCGDSLMLEGPNAITTVEEVTCKGLGKVPGNGYCRPSKGVGRVTVQSIDCNGDENSVTECEKKMGTVCNGGLWIGCS